MSRSLGVSAMPGKGTEPFFLFSQAVSELLSLKFKPQLVAELLQLLWMQHDKEKKLWVAPLFPNDHFVTCFTNVQLCHLRKENS